MDLRLWSPLSVHRGRLAQEIGQKRDVVRVRVLVKLLQDRNSAVRQTAALSLGDIADPATLPILLDHLGSEKEECVRWAVAKSVGDFRDKRGVASLKQALSDSPSVRAHAASGLAEIGDKAVLPDLIAVMRSDPTWAVGPLLAACKKLGWQPTLPYERAVDAFASNNREEFLAGTDDSVRYLRLIALEPLMISTEHQVLAVHLLAEFDCESATQALREISRRGSRQDV